MLHKKRRALEPSFVLVLVLASATAAAGVACGRLAESDVTSSRERDGGIRDNPPPLGPRPIPQFGATVSLADAPPALGAATLLIAADGKAVATDPDRDRVLVVDVDAEVSTSIPLATGDVPGRMALDDAGHAFVVLQRAGEIATIDTIAATLTERRRVCPAPRGITAVDDGLVVACAGGELVSLPRTGGTATLLANLGPDLRDVVSNGTDRILVSHLRTTELLLVDRQGALLARKRPRPIADTIGAVAWRLVPTHAKGPGGAPSGALLVHQRTSTTTTTIANTPRGTASMLPCDAPLRSEVTTFDFDPTGFTTTEVVYADATLPVDVTSAPSGDVALVAAGNGHLPELAQVQLRSWARSLPSGCVAQPSTVDEAQSLRQPNLDPPGQAVAVAFRGSGELLVLTREPAFLHRVDPTLRLTLPIGSALPWRTIVLGGASREDTGHAIFHTNSGGGIACASCHPDGADDGLIWVTPNREGRRTQSLQGTLANTAPYQWNGDAPNIAHIGETIFTGQMLGPALADGQKAALEHWLLRVPRVAPSVFARGPAARGKALFEGPAACATCHSGPAFTNNQNISMGFGEKFQVPSLIGVAIHAPYFHDGQVRTLREAFVGHGRGSALSETEQDELLAYLETL